MAIFFQKDLGPVAQPISIPFFSPLLIILLFSFPLSIYHVPLAFLFQGPFSWIQLRSPGPFQDPQLGRLWRHYERKRTHFEACNKAPNCIPTSSDVTGLAVDVGYQSLSNSSRNWSRYTGWAKKSDTLLVGIWDSSLVACITFAILGYSRIILTNCR